MLGAKLLLDEQAAGKGVPHPAFPLCNLPQKKRGRTKGRKPAFITGCGKIFQKEIGFSAPFRLRGGVGYDYPIYDRT
jgi:hypothetical protein